MNCDNVLDEMALFLAERHIRVPRDWLIHLRQWMEFHEPQQFDKMPTAAYLHILQTDLRDLKSGCLPQDIANVNVVKTNLSGNFFLQVNNVMDIGRSAYSQLKKLEGVRNCNSEIDCDQPLTQFSENNCRTLYFELTDGVQTVSAMEWLPMPFLNVKISPGSKILVHGNVECRRGVLLLCEANTKLLGGHVEELFEENNQKNLLKRKFNRLMPDADRASRVDRGDHGDFNEYITIPSMASNGGHAFGTMFDNHDFANEEELDDFLLNYCD